MGTLNKDLVLEYLYTICMENKHKYVKSRHIAKELGLSTKQVGAYLWQFSKKNPIIKGCRLSIGRYSYTNSTTWVVSGKICG